MTDETPKQPAEKDDTMTDDESDPHVPDVTRREAMSTPAKAAIGGAGVLGLLGLSTGSASAQQSLEPAQVLRDDQDREVRFRMEGGDLLIEHVPSENTWRLNADGLSGQTINTEETGSDPSSNGEMQRNGSDIKAYSGGAVRNLSNIGSGGGGSSETVIASPSDDLQTKIDQAEADDDTLILTEGTFDLSGGNGVTVGSDLVIDGAGPGATVLQGADSDDGSATTYMGTENSPQGVSNLTIRNLTIDGQQSSSSSSPQGLLQVSGSNILLENVHLKNGARYCLTVAQTDWLLAYDCVFDTTYSDDTITVNDGSETTLVSSGEESFVSDNIYFVDCEIAGAGGSRSTTDPANSHGVSAENAPAGKMSLVRCDLYDNHTGDFQPSETESFDGGPTPHIVRFEDCRLGSTTPVEREWNGNASRTADLVILDDCELENGVTGVTGSSSPAASNFLVANNTRYDSLGGGTPTASNYFDGRIVRDLDSTNTYLVSEGSSVRIDRNSSTDGGGSSPPDEGDLQAQYDAQSLSLSDGNSVSTWGDESGNGHDLTAGTAPTYVTSGINGNPGVQFNGTDQYLDVSWTSYDEPYQIFAVVKLESADTGTSQTVLDGGSQDEHRFYENAASASWRIYQGGTTVDGVGTDTNPHLFNLLFQPSGNNDVIRFDGSEVGAADSGSASSTGLTVGSRADQDQWANVTVGEILVYPIDKTASESEIESYLANKWGISI